MPAGKPFLKQVLQASSKQELLTDPCRDRDDQKRHKEGSPAVYMEQLVKDGFGLARSLGEKGFECRA